MKHASRDYALMMFITIVGKYQPYGAYGIYIGGQSLCCIQRNCGWSEFSVKKLRLLLMIAVEELSTINGIPSVSHEEGLSLGRAAVNF